MADQLLDLICTDEKLTEAMMNGQLTQQSVAFTEKDIKRILSDKKNCQDVIDDLKVVQDKIEKESSSLKEELEKQMAKSQPNIKEITERLVKERLDEAHA